MSKRINNFDIDISDSDVDEEIDTKINQYYETVKKPKKKGKSAKEVLEQNWMWFEDDCEDDALKLKIKELEASCTSSVAEEKIKELELKNQNLEALLSKTSEQLQNIQAKGTDIIDKVIYEPVAKFFEDITSLIETYPLGHKEEFKKVYSVLEDSIKNNLASIIKNKTDGGSNDNSIKDINDVVKEFTKEIDTTLQILDKQGEQTTNLELINQELKNTLNQNETEITLLKQEISTMQNKINDKETQIDNLSSKIDEIKKENTEKLEKCETENASLVSQINETKNDVEKCKTENSSLLNQIIEIKKENTEKLEKCETENSSLVSKIEETKNDVEKYKTENSSLVNKIEETKNDVEKYKTENSSLLNQIIEIKKENTEKLEKCETENSSLVSKIEETKNDVEKYKTENSSLLNQIIEIKKENTEKLEKCETENSSLVSKIEETKNDVEKYKTENSSLVNKIEETKNDVEKYKTENSSLLNQIIEIKKENTEKLEKCETENASLVSKIEETKNDLEKCKTENVEISNNLEKYKKENTEIVEKYNAENTSLLSKIDETEKENASLVNKIDETKKENAEILEKFKTENAKLLNETKNENMKLSSVNTELLTKINVINNEKIELSSNLDVLKNNNIGNTELALKCDAIKKELEQKQTELDKQINEKQNTINDLSKQLNQTKQEVMGISNDLNKKYQDELNKNTELTTKLAQKEKEVEKIQTELEQKDKQEPNNIQISDERDIIDKELLSTNNPELLAQFILKSEIINARDGFKLKEQINPEYSIYNKIKDEEQLSSKILTGYVYDIKQIFDNIKNNFFRMFLCLFSFPTDFKKFIRSECLFPRCQQIKINHSDEDPELELEINKFILIFFIDLTKYPLLVDKIYNENDTYVKSQIKRDTDFVHQYNSNLEKVMMKFTFFKDIVNFIKQTQNMNRVLLNDKYTAEIFKLLQNVQDTIMSLENIMKLYKPSEGELKIIVQKIIQDRKKCFSCLFYRYNNDGDKDININPRYNLKIIPNEIIVDASKSKGLPAIRNKYLTVTYSDSDKRIGIVEKDDDGANQKSQIPVAVDKPKPTKKSEYYDPKLAIEQLKEDNTKDIDVITFGPIDMIFDDLNQKKKEKAESMARLQFMEKFLDGKENLCFILSGASGAGKTTTGIGNNTEDGILIELCKLPRFIETYDKMELTMVNIYFSSGAKYDTSNNFDTENYQIRNIGLPDLTTNEDELHPIFLYDKVRGWFYENGKKRLSDGISEAFTKREIEPTPNNKESSRSHVIVSINARRRSDGDIQQMVFWDLAGDEGMFEYDKWDIMKKLINSYITSDKYKDNPNSIILDKHFCEYEPKNIELETKYNELVTEMNAQIDKYIKYKTINNISVNDGRKRNLSDGGYCKPLKVVQSKLQKDDQDKAKIFTSNFASIVDYNEYVELMRKKIIDQQGKVLLLKNAVIIFNFMNKLKANGHFDDDTKFLEVMKKYPNFFAKIDKITQLQTGTTIPNTQIDSRLIKNTTAETTKMAFLLSNNEFSNYLGFGLVACAYSLMGNDRFAYPVSTNKDGHNSYVRHRVQINNVLKKPEILKFETDFKKEVKTYFDMLYEYHFVITIHFNLLVRDVERKGINYSLLQMRKCVKNLILNSISTETGVLPLYFDKETYETCSNLFIEDDDIYDRFYPNVDNSSCENDKITSIMQNDMNIDLSKLTFVMFTVINLTNDIKTNNPPNPPYTNISSLLYTNEIKGFPDFKSLNKEIENVMTRLGKHRFYQENSVFQQLKKRYNPDKFEFDELQKFAKELINLVRIYNPLTLMGSLETMDMLPTISTFGKIDCIDNKELEKERGIMFPKFNIE